MNESTDRTPGAGTKKVFVAATGKDQGKTTISLGLMAAFEELCPPVRFIKPVGQRYVEVEGVRVDEDSALMRSIYPGMCNLGDTSPVTVPRSFTRDYILRPRPKVLADKILKSFARLTDGAGAAVIEGTGHAGVGSCFDTSNADVAALLDAKVILVAGGGIGKPIDEVMLNQGLLAQRGVELLGVILNKVLPSKMDSITHFVRTGLKRLGIELLGAVPYEPALCEPTMRQILNELGGELLHGDDSLDRPVEHVLVGAMTAANAMEYIRPGCLLITPGDREDLILTVANLFAGQTDPAQRMAGILLTGGIRPPAKIMEFIERTNIPVVLREEDSYRVATDVDDLKVKIQPQDTAKIETASRIVQDHLDVEQIMDRL